ncbi:uncharacterized protein LOC131330497 [Rhododendron vialii]|uniref:uncharacterized protein LOC131330497 n=1 Tax=Rhododendron vialii TaxID=182163 RepID=UPI00265EB946|nr:uncharacterized protein LOC131330497 [Rhododendron vialii]
MTYEVLYCIIMSRRLEHIFSKLKILERLMDVQTWHADGWTDQKQVPIINFLVYSPKGSMFLKSVDTSGLIKDADTLLGIFDEVVELVGPKNIVQFVTDNEAAYKAAGKRLQAKHGSFFWSPCAAHCLDLMLENFANPKHLPRIDAVIQQAKKVTRFIYNHAWVVNLMRKDFTNGRDLCRPGITRFATNFLSLQCLLKFKKELHQMFTSDKWVGSRYAKSIAGKEIGMIILEDREFWSECQTVVKVSDPLVRVLRLADSEEKPSMGYLYEAMDKAKEAIKTRLQNGVSLYTPYTRVVDARWDRQLYSPLHAAGCFLNPGIYFRPTFTKQKDVSRGLVMAITVLVPDNFMQEKISEQLEEYKQSTGHFGMSLAIRQRERLNPVAWWEQFGNDCRDLQSFAIRILSQCCSATGCERNWSTFEFIHSKKRNRLEHKRLNDLVFVRYNLKLRERNISRRKDAFDPISLDNIDVIGDWISEEPSLLAGEDLGWELVEPPSLENLTLVDEPCFDDGEDNLPAQNESQYDWVGDGSFYFGGEQDPYNYVQ